MTYLVMTIMFVGGFLFGYLTGYGTDRREALQPTEPAVKESLTTPAGWQLVPKELIDFLDAKEHHLPVEDRHVLSIMLESAPKFGEEE